MINLLSSVDPISQLSKNEWVLPILSEIHEFRKRNVFTQHNWERFFLSLGLPKQQVEKLADHIDLRTDLRNQPIIPRLEYEKPYLENSMVSSYNVRYTNDMFPPEGGIDYYSQPVCDHNPHVTGLPTCYPIQYQPNNRGNVHNGYYSNPVGYPSSLNQTRWEDYIPEQPKKIALNQPPFDYYGHQGSSCNQLCYSVHEQQNLEQGPGRLNHAVDQIHYKSDPYKNLNCDTRHHVTIPTYLSFDGQGSWPDFEENFRYFIRTNHIEDETSRISYLREIVQGRVSCILELLISRWETSREEMHLDNVLLALQKECDGEYQNRTKAYPMLDLTRQREDEPPLVFAERLWKTACQAYPKGVHKSLEEHVVFCFCDGLVNREAANFLRCQNLTSMAMAEELFIRFHFSQYGQIIPPHASYSSTLGNFHLYSKNEEIMNQASAQSPTTPSELGQRFQSMDNKLVVQEATIEAQDELSHLGRKIEDQERKLAIQDKKIETPVSTVEEMKILLNKALESSVEELKILLNKAPKCNENIVSSEISSYESLQEEKEPSENQNVCPGQDQSTDSRHYSKPECCRSVDLSPDIDAESYSRYSRLVYVRNCVVVLSYN